MSFWESFWAVVGWFLWAAIFIAYLMALFSVLADIVRDETLKGWAKAIWVVFLIFVPFLTALVYLVARGDGMSERTVTAARRAQEGVDERIRSVVHVDPATQIEKAAALLHAGTITQAEYEQLKARALAS